MALNEMVERAAKAAHTAAYASRDSFLMPDWVKVAEAVIAALRDPTADMIQAGEDYRSTLAAWRAMIDVALERKD